MIHEFRNGDTSAGRDPVGEGAGHADSNAAFAANLHSSKSYPPGVPAHPSPQDLGAYTGAYTIQETDAVYRVVFEDGIPPSISCRGERGEKLALRQTLGGQDFADR
jgi:hypothetical protein